MKVVNLRKLILLLALGVCAGAGTGAAVPSGATSRVHWLGSRQLTATPEARQFQTLWNLPESAAMQKQLLDKLAGATNAMSKADARLRALFEDVLREESFAEVRHEPNQPGAAVFAIRLNAERARLWESKPRRAAAGNRAGPRRRVDAPWQGEGRESVARGMAGTHRQDRRAGRARGDEFLAGGGRGPAAGGAASGAGLEVAGGLAAHFRDRDRRWRECADARQFEFRVAAGSETRAVAHPDESDPRAADWLRGGARAGAGRDGFGILEVDADRRGAGADVCLVAGGRAVSDILCWAAAGCGRRGCNRFPRGCSARATRGRRPTGLGGFEPLPGGVGVAWKSVPFMAPFMQSAAWNQREYVYGGLFPLAHSSTNATIPAELLSQVNGMPRLVLYDWELTGARMGGWLQIGQLFRVMFRQAQLPANSAGLMWLRALTPKLGNTVTVVTQTEARELKFTRKSSSGVTALELHLLADWMESPNFPQGLNTFRGPAFGAKPPQPSPPPAVPPK